MFIATSCYVRLQLCDSLDMQSLSYCNLPSFSFAILLFCYSCYLNVTLTPMFLLLLSASYYGVISLTFALQTLFTLTGSDRIVE